MVSDSDRDQRPSPEALLRAANREQRGRLKIFLGAAPGVGKTYEMLTDGAAQLRDGRDVVIGVVETHGRTETQALVEPLEVVPRRVVDYRGHRLEEMDLDAVIARRPDLALVDEFAHSNAEGSRHPKRWQDVMELLDVGIDVYTTLNIQHVESLNDVVAGFTRVRVRETVPDTVFDGAEVEVVDIPPDELIERLKAGKVYIPAEASRALDRFFSRPNLSALREMALRRAAMSVDQSLLEDLATTTATGTFAGGERVLVAVSELPGSDQLVRVAKRLADALKAPWQAVFIETPRAAGFSADQRQRVGESLRLAATLGATIATVPAVSVIEGLRTHVAGMRATQLVIGKSVRSWWFELRHGSVVDAMLRAGEGLAVHVIPGEAKLSAPRQAAALLRGWGGVRDYVVLALLLAVTTLIAKLAEPLIGMAGVDLLYLPPVIIGSIWAGLRPGLIAGIAAGLAYNFFFLPPLYTFTIADPRSLLTVFVLIGIAVFTGNLSARLRDRANLGARSAQENAAVAAFGQSLARVSDWDGTSRIVCEEMARTLNCSVILLNEREGELVRVAACPPDQPDLGPVDRAAADWAWSRGEPAGVGTGTLVAAEWQFHPLRTALGTLALIGLANDGGGNPVSADRALLFSTLLGQAALAHERLTLEDQVREVSVLRERDRLRAALLSSIGHDLRTPLTGVAAAIDALAAEGQADDKTVRMAQAEVGRLKRFLDNLVDMVRIDSGALNLSIEPTDLTDAVVAAVHDLRAVLASCTIDLRVPPNLPLVRADPRLLHHILINLLANAATHGGGDRIIVSGRRMPDGVVLSIADNGPGLPDGAQHRVFETFRHGDGNDRHGGSGLGLAIAKGFAEAMQARVSAANGAEGGAEFSISLRPWLETAPTIPDEPAGMNG
ncbi:sensor histidine kinase KdpD [Sphingomonas sp. BGYR3]|uniref:sensor histidine kinase n=1 Tax=Sphingomonas sp. BGYR3 TaxID=2975483 RepID=UPI0021A6E2D6|nr:sensor histidine kinase KdpD [Sphingomonas sp. BGYR3]